MATKPTTGHLDWIADDDTDKFAAPSVAKQLAGWIAEEKPPFQYFNWAWRLIDRWLKYFETQTDENEQAIGAHANLTSPHSATSDATADRLIVRDANGRAKVAAPSANDDIARKDTVNSLIPSGTVMLFGQNSPPTGWTRKSDWQDNAMLCYAASGNIENGGSANAQNGHTHGMQGHTHDGPSHSHSTGDHALTVTEMPSHTHSVNNGANALLSPGGSSAVQVAGGGTSGVIALSAANTGGGSAHNHGSTGDAGTDPTSGPSNDTTSANAAPYYQEVIAATKD